MALSLSTSADPRLPVLQGLYERYHSPLVAHVAEFLWMADEFRLDWRLMPALSIIESGGRNLRNNNVFGWGNGAIRFRSISESIRVIAERLANDSPYRGKTFEGMMRAYNPANKGYAFCVRRVMAGLGNF